MRIRYTVRQMHNGEFGAARTAAPLVSGGGDGADGTVRQQIDRVLDNLDADDHRLILDLIRSLRLRTVQL